MNSRREVLIEDDTAPSLPKSEPPVEYEKHKSKTITKSNMGRGKRRAPPPPQRQLSSDKPGREYDGSVSEESGVYTQASNDSRLKQEDNRGYSSPPDGEISHRPGTTRLSQPHTLAEFEIEPIGFSPKSKSAKATTSQTLKSEKPHKFQDKEKYVPLFSRDKRPMTVQNIDIDVDQLENGDEQYTSTSTLQDISDHLGNSPKLEVEEVASPKVEATPVTHAPAKHTPVKHANVVKVDSVPIAKPKCNGHIQPIIETYDSELTVREITEEDNIEADLSHYDTKTSSSYENVYENSFVSADGGMRTSQYTSGGGGYTSDYDLVGQAYSTEVSSFIIFSGVYHFSCFFLFILFYILFFSENILSVHHF